jgi:hypothetical protein
MLFNGENFKILHAPDAGDGGTGGEATAEAIVYIEKKDPITGTVVKIPKDLESLLGHYISHTRGEVEKKFKPIVEELEKEKTDLTGIKAAYDKLKEDAMSAEDRAAANAKKVISEFEKKSNVALSEADKFKKLFHKSVVENDILTSFGDIKLCNAKQVALLFENEGNAHPEEVIDGDGKATGRYETKVALTLENDKKEPVIVEGTPAELFSRWIKLERNAHHIRNDTVPGAGSRQGTNYSGNSTAAEMLKLDPKNRIDAHRAKK